MLDLDKLQARKRSDLKNYHLLKFCENDLAVLSPQRFRDCERSCTTITNLLKQNAGLNVFIKSFLPL